ncbi:MULTISPECIES: hypothetical protein [Serratia]|uniref:hypothetical protein n=1 Tax=Serratia TaxID=613 RepID=UPI00066083BA|nr:hypothetical protein [Serratia sp. 506_PEND]
MVKRYNPDYVMHAARFEPFAREAEHGEFVKFSDYEALVSELASSRQINAQTLQVKLTMAETIKELTDRVDRLSGMLTESRVATKSAEERADALAVENAALKEFIKKKCFVVPAGASCLAEADECAEGSMPETPATDAALAAIEVRGVEKFIKLKMEQLANMHPDTHAFGATAESLRAQINELQAFAVQLRGAK